MKRKVTMTAVRHLPSSDALRIDAYYDDGGQTQVDVPGVWLKAHGYTKMSDSIVVFEHFMREQLGEGENKPKCYMHQYKKYEGFSEIYHYCTLCDHKDHEMWKMEKK